METGEVGVDCKLQGFRVFGLQKKIIASKWGVCVCVCVMCVCDVADLSAVDMKFENPDLWCTYWGLNYQL